MSEYLIQGETLTSIADEIRELSGTTTAMGLDDMTSNLGEANDEVVSQSELIEDIIAALEGKAIAEPKLQDKTVVPSAVTQTITADSGYDGMSSVMVYGDSNLLAENIAAGKTIFGIVGTASSGGDVGKCTAIISTNTSFAVIYSLVDKNNNVSTTWTTESTTNHTIITASNSYIFVPVISTIPGYNISGQAEFITTLSGYSAHRTMVFKITAADGETVTITCYDDD